MENVYIVFPSPEARFPDMFCNFYLVKSYKIAKNSTTTKAREKISTDLESLIRKEFLSRINQVYY
jgi:hypothetical protein